MYVQRACLTAAPRFERPVFMGLYSLIGTRHKKYMYPRRTFSSFLLSLHLPIRVSLARADVDSMPSSVKASAPSSGAKRKLAAEELPSAEESDNKFVNPENTATTDSTEQRAPHDNPEDIVRKMFLEAAAKPCPESKIFSGSSGSISAEGIMIRAHKVNGFNKQGAAAPKLQVSVLVSKLLTNGATAAVTSGVPGVAFVLPTKRLEPSPDEVAKDANAKGALVFDMNENRAGYVGMIHTNFYLDPQAAKTGKKTSASGDASLFDACTPGTRVLITDISVVFGKGDREHGLPLYCNAKKLQPLEDSVHVGKIAESLVRTACSAGIQQNAAVLLSCCMQGFYGVEYSRQETAEQAKCFTDKWEAIVTNVATRLDAMATAKPGGGDSPACADALLAQAARVRKLSPADVAQGVSLFDCDLLERTATPYVVPIVQVGVKPGDRTGGMCMALLDPARREELPSMFVDALVLDVKFEKSLIHVNYRLFFIGDKKKAIESINAGKAFPFLMTPMAAASVKMTNRTFGPEVIGSNVSAKIKMAATELIPIMDHVSIASVYPRQADSLVLDAHFTPNIGYDMINGITKVGVQVSQEWLDTNMLGGRGVLIHKLSDDAEVIDPLPNVGPTPTLTRQFYQAISEGSFDFDSLKPPEGKTTKYFVLYEGCSANAVVSPSISTSVKDGEDHLTDIAPAIQADGDIKTFLKETALVYAVAV